MSPFLYIFWMWGHPAIIPPSSLLCLKSLVKLKFLIYTEFARNLLFRLFRAGKNSHFFGTLSSIQYQDVLGKSTGTYGLKILRRVISVPVRVRPPAFCKRLKQKVLVFFLLVHTNARKNTCGQGLDHCICCVYLLVVIKVCINICSRWDRTVS